MQKVTDLYPPEIAGHKLQDHFAGNTVMLELIQKLNKTMNRHGFNRHLRVI